MNRLFILLLVVGCSNSVEPNSSRLDLGVELANCRVTVEEYDSAFELFASEILKEHNIEVFKVGKGFEMDSKSFSYTPPVYYFKKLSEEEMKARKIREALKNFTNGDGDAVKDLNRLKELIK